jgi:hypothetical protein
VSSDGVVTSEWDFDQPVTLTGANATGLQLSSDGVVWHDAVSATQGTATTLELVYAGTISVDSLQYRVQNPVNNVHLGVNNLPNQAGFVS